jgi:2,4-dienoyl-CoA reductase|tara:strand:- start:8720 stop:9529 length:810 start_codon:yes stop_codon:yes gene_type:complete
MYKNIKVLITGANSGLGKNMAINYAKQQATIINLSRNIYKGEKLKSTLDNINKQNNLFFSSDVSNYNKILDIKNKLVETNNIPNIIINNAAGNFLCPFEKLSKNGWTRIIDIVLNGSFNIYHIFGKEFIKQKKPGIFLNISTTYSTTGSAMVSPSAAAKSGVDTMIKSLISEWTQYNMRFVGIAPGAIINSGGLSKLDPFNVYKHYNNYTNPLKRMCHPDEISNLAMFLTSDKASYINGHTVRIDGGEYNKNSGQFNFITNIPFYKKLL